MIVYQIPVRLDVAAIAYVEAENPEQARHLATEGQWLCYREDERAEVLPPEVEGTDALAVANDGYAELVLLQLVQHAQRHAEAMSQVSNHPPMHLLDAAMALLDASGLNREQALTQAIEDCRRALGENPPAWAEMRALLHEVLPLSKRGIATRIRAFLNRLEQPNGIPTVRVDVSGGTAHVVAKPRGTAVEIRDYDTEGADPEEWELCEDPDLDPGNFYTRVYVGPDEEPTG